jgi:hypothetical protein
MRWCFAAGLAGFSATSLLLKGLKHLVAVKPQSAVVVIAFLMFVLSSLPLLWQFQRKSKK